ncbi:hypothetical protein H8356DRAFT_1325048 [Neocallimastix lanati (nom. inval.)]|nr:hypothetical protein H8356DRAFT_1325048 [Neocallimastix sp. JGI-2020a]
MDLSLASSLSLKCIRLSLDSDENLSLSQENMKDISYKLLYKMGFFLERNSFTNPFKNQSLSALAII